MDPKFNLWIENRNAVVLSSWRVGLLRAVDQTGSVALAAKAIKVSERTARKKLREMRTGVGFDLLAPEKGAAGRGPLRLTARGHKLVGQFEKFAAGLDKEIGKRFAAAFRN
jgi:molybdate transport repressor ModE-like protein